MNLGAVGYPTLQEVQPRPTSMYSQVSSACSPSASFSGPFIPPAGVVVPPPPPPPAHSSFYSGMAGPQHPFYNRVSLTRHADHQALFLICRACGGVALVQRGPVTTSRVWFRLPLPPR